MAHKIVIPGTVPIAGTYTRQIEDEIEEIKFIATLDSSENGIKSGLIVVDPSYDGTDREY